MTEKRPSDPKLQTVDIVKLFDNQQFKNATEYTNGIFQAFSDPVDVEPGEDKVAEDAMQAYNQSHFGLDWLERDARVSVIAEDGETGELGIYDFNAKFIGAEPGISVQDVLIDRERIYYVKDMAVRALTLRFIDGDDEYYVPLNRESLLRCEVDIPMPRSSEKTPAGLLQHDAETFGHVLASSTFLGCGIKDQKAQIADMVEYTNDNSLMLGDKVGQTRVTAFTNDGAGITTYDAKSLKAAFPWPEDRVLPYGATEEYEYGGRLFLEITDTETSTVTLIPADTVVNIERHRDISDSHIPSTDGETVDVLNQFFASEHIMNAMNDIENWINAPFETDAERDEAIIEALEDISRLVPEEFFDYGFKFTGTAFYQDKNDNITAHLVMTEDAHTEGFDIVELEGKWRVVFPLMIDRADTPSITMPIEQAYATCYVLPYAPYTKRLASFETDDTPEFLGRPEDLLDTCAEACKKTRRIIASKRFRTSRRDRQTELLKAGYADLIDMVARVAGQKYDEIVTCMANEYYVNDMRFDSMRCQEIADMGKVDVSEIAPERRPAINGTVAAVAIPELRDVGNKPFRSLKDFPLSKGEPMIIIEDEPANKVYFIPARNLTYLAPITSDAEYGGNE